jgi:catechol 2,3-dioxygenase-like lactoylglutathione lyase family enzyme
MISDLEPLATLPVKDMGPARQFYEGVLGLSSKMEGPDGSVVYGAGSGAVMVYPSAFAGTNKATAVSFQVPMDGFDAEVSALRAKGVSFQTFEADELTWDDGVASFGDDYRSVWFEDPDGNILNLVAASFS